MKKNIIDIKHKLFSDIIAVPSVFEQSYFPSLDGLRAVSIIMVLVFHILMSYKTNVDFHPLANLGVQFFFVISGFLITTLLIKEKIKTGTISLKKFYIRRTLRIIPVAYLYLILVLILNVILDLHLNYVLLLTSFLFIRNFFMNAKGVDHLTTHYWSLSVEEQFYILFPAIVKKNIMTYLFFLLGILFVSILLDFIHPADYLIESFMFSYVLIVLKLITQFQGIAIGAVFSVFIFKGILSFEKFNKNNSTLITIALFVCIIALTFYKGAYHSMITISECILFGCILVINLHPQNGLGFSFLNHSAMKWIGVLSYSIYIWQQPLTLNLSYINKTAFMQGVENKLPINIFISIGSLLILLVISYLSYNFYEKKFLVLKERFK